MPRVYAVLDQCGEKIGDVAANKIRAMRESGWIRISYDRQAVQSQSHSTKGSGPR